MALDQSALLDLLEALKAADVDDRVRAATETLYQALIEAELTAAIGAAPHERVETRTAQRNGSRPRTLTTAAGDLELRIPKLRVGSFFPSLLERRRRIDQALFAVVMEAYLHGVSTRKVDDLVKALGADSGISKSEVSRICADLDAEVAVFRDRSLAEQAFRYVFLDATYCKARVDRRVVSQAVVIATGVAADGHREVLGFVIGGAGYIGAHVVAAMREAGESVVVLDDRSTGDPDRIPGALLVVGTVLDGLLVARTLRDHDVTGVVHVAAKKQVEESVRLPLLYYRENVEGLRVLLEQAVEAGVGSLVFSSSAAVYGMPDVDLVGEDTECRPVNPYGTTKLVGERMIVEVTAATGLGYVNLRYFNVAGTADPALTDRGVSNLVPMVFQRLSQRQAPLVFGDTHPTPDGTCVRDFVHIADIATAHVAAARALAEGR